MTSRGRWFLGAAFVFYMFANQTQIGWLYIIAGLLVGLILAAGVLNRGAARGIRVQRTLAVKSRIEGGEPIPFQEASGLYEADPVTLTLLFTRESALPAVQVSITQDCPLADPASDAAHTTLYVPMLNRDTPLQYTLEFPLYRRGVHRFPPIEISSAAPFGFFTQSRPLVQPDPQVIYPEYRPLSRFAFLDRRDMAEQTRPSAGYGSEIMGVRPYRTGDPLRHIHWASVARTGQLVSKEFAEESQPRVALVLDRCVRPWPSPSHPQAPFELLVKAVLSVGDYAMRRGFTVSLHADETGLAHPYGPLTQTMLLDYLARVSALPEPSLGETLEALKRQGITFVVVFTSAWESLPQEALRDINSLLLVTVADQSDSGEAIKTGLGVSTCVLSGGQDWAVALENAGER